MQHVLQANSSNKVTTPEKIRKTINDKTTHREISAHKTFHIDSSMYTNSVFKQTSTKPKLLGGTYKMNSANQTGLKNQQARSGRTDRRRRSMFKIYIIKIAQRAQTSFPRLTTDFIRYVRAITVRSGI